MKIIKALYLFLLSAAGLVVFLFIAGVTLREAENPLDAYSRIDYGPFSFRMLEAVLLSVIAVPTFVFCGLRAIQLSTSRLADWPTLKPLALEFAIIGTLVTAYMLVAVTDWDLASRTSFTPMLEGKAPQVAPTLTDESVEFPTLPLQKLDPYADNMLFDLAGQPVPMSSFRGKPLFFNWWATWCGPCREEMPSIERLYESMKDQGVAFAMVSNEDPAKVKAFADKEGYKFPIYTVKSELPQPLSVEAYPTTIFLTPTGEVAYTHRGSTAWDGEKTRSFLQALAGLPSGSE